MTNNIIDRLLILFEDDINIIKDEIITFTEKKYKYKKNYKCYYCNSKPTKKWEYKKKIIKVCNYCCNKNRDTFFLEL